MNCFSSAKVSGAFSHASIHARPQYTGLRRVQLLGKSATFVTNWTEGVLVLGTAYVFVLHVASHVMATASAAQTSVCGGRRQNDHKTLVGTPCEHLTCVKSITKFAIAKGVATVVVAADDAVAEKRFPNTMGYASPFPALVSWRYLSLE